MTPSNKANLCPVETMQLVKIYTLKPSTTVLTATVNPARAPPLLLQPELCPLTPHHLPQPPSPGRSRMDQRYPPLGLHCDPLISLPLLPLGKLQRIYSPLIPQSQRTLQSFLTHHVMRVSERHHSYVPIKIWWQSSTSSDAVEHLRVKRIIRWVISVLLLLSKASMCVDSQYTFP